MKKLISQLSDFDKDLSLSEKIVNFLACVTFIVLWYAGVFTFYKYLESQAEYSYPYVEGYLGQLVQLFTERTPSVLEQFFIMCVLAPLWEEICFRKAPIDVGKSLNLDKTALASLILAMSSVFALGHPLGILSIPVQGVFGLTTAWLYLKNKNIWWSISFHSLWNGLLLFKILD